MEKYPILQICRTERFKIDWYIPKPETFCNLSGERQLCITTYFISEASPLFTVSFPPASDHDERFSNLDTEDALGFEDKLDPWPLCI